MGAVFQILPLHDGLGHGVKLLLVRDPSGLDGGLAGDGVQQFIPDGILMLPAAVQQVGGQTLHRLGGVVRAQIHGDLPQQHGAVAEFLQLKAQLLRLADGRQVNLILTTGGTGFSPRDITPEATCAVADRNAPGIAEAMRYHSLSITPRGMLSRGVSVLRGKTLIVNLPGSPKAVQENLEYILPSLEHGVRIAAGLDGECARK